MHFTGNIYRPPLEANTPLLEVTYGCSWNKCAFCSMYNQTKFGVSPYEHIREDLEEIRQAYSDRLKKIFVVNGDPFTLPTENLLKISEIIHEYLPKIETISCYTSVRNIRNKSIEQLSKLRKAGYNYLYIGLESGNEYALELMNKGYTVEEEYQSLEKIEEAGIKYNAILMYGVTGQAKTREHIEDTAKLLNRYKPEAILVTGTSVEANTPLEQYTKDGKFVPLTERQLIREEYSLLDKLEMNDDCYYFGSHPFNLIRVSDYFKNKDKMLKYIKEKTEKIDNARPGLLDTVLPRGSL